MQTLTASVNLDAEAMAALHKAARFFSMPVPAFLDICLERGIEQATTLAASADMADEFEDEPEPSPCLESDEIREAKAEGAALVTLLREMRERTRVGQGRTFRFTFTVPEELATVAAWQAFKDDMAAAGKPGPLPRSVELRREGDGYPLADWYRARAVMWTLISRGLRRDWDMLENGTHHRLYPGLAGEKESRWVLADDIPF